jgi:hypothetical protein
LPALAGASEIFRAFAGLKAPKGGETKSARADFKGNSGDAQMLGFYLPARFLSRKNPGRSFEELEE